MESKEVFHNLIHHHPMIPWNDMRRGACCGGFDATTNGYYCKKCGFFFHKKCVESSEYIQNPSHSAHTLQRRYGSSCLCTLCGNFVREISYRCDICNFNIDLHCLKYPPLEVIDASKMHCHKLTLLKEFNIEFNCDANCGKTSYGFPYKCHECDLSFHVDCVWRPSESELPLEQYLLDLKTHDHQLTLLPRLDSFTCNACGLKGDRSPYICVQCDFVIHQDCVGLPRVININRHDHRISRTYVIGVVNSVCGVCRKKVNWTCGGYSCQKCQDYVVHSKCATRDDVWNGEELEDVPEEIEDIEPYVIIDDNTIQHFTHKKHHLKLNVNDLLWDDNKRCCACTHPICLQSFYCCMDCDFTLHQKCAELPKKKWHVLHNRRLSLVTSFTMDNFFMCDGCDSISNGFMYTDEFRNFGVCCGSISEPVIHPSHPSHPLYRIPGEGYEICNGCNKSYSCFLTCIEYGCGFFLCFKCAALPQVVKHRVDNHPLSLCYGEKANGKYWCDICEKETNPNTWFYTCKDDRASLHVECVNGFFSELMPKSKIEIHNTLFKVVMNTSVSRPFCRLCKSRCIPPIILKMRGTSDGYICSLKCEP